MPGNVLLTIVIDLQLGRPGRTEPVSQQPEQSSANGPQLPSAQLRQRIPAIIVGTVLRASVLLVDHRRRCPLWRQPWTRADTSRTESLSSDAANHSSAAADREERSSQPTGTATGGPGRTQCDHGGASGGVGGAKITSPKGSSSDASPGTRPSGAMFRHPESSRSRRRRRGTITSKTHSLHP